MVSGLWWCEDCGRYSVLNASCESCLKPPPPAAWNAGVTLHFTGVCIPKEE